MTAPINIFLISHRVSTVSPSNISPFSIFGFNLVIAIYSIILYNQLMDLATIEERIKKLKSPKFDYALNTPREKEILAKTVKLNEEVGELCMIEEIFIRNLQMFSSRSCSLQLLPTLILSVLSKIN
jgi:hypothetical protein